MERMKILFYGTDRSQTNECFIQVFANEHEEILVEIKDENSDYDLGYQFICLNKQTAIKLVKELKKSIGQLD